MVNLGKGRRKRQTKKFSIKITCDNPFCNNGVNGGRGIFFISGAMDLKTCNTVCSKERKAYIIAERASA